MRVRHGVVRAVVPYLLLAAVTACGYGSRAAEDDGRPVAAHGRKLSVDSVRIGYFPNLTHATALVGVEQGFIQEELGGTQLKAVAFSAGPSEIEALNAGAIDIGFIGPSPAVNGYTRSGGRNLRIVSGAASGGVSLVVDPRKIRTPGDVKGRRIATPQLGNTQDVAFLNWVAEQGWKVDPRGGDGDVSVIRTDPKVIPDAYRSGAVDGAWVPEPTASQLVAEGAKVLLDEATLWPEQQFVITNVVVSQRFLREHPDVVEAVLRGTVRTNRWIRAHPADAGRAANAALEELTGKELPAPVLAHAWPRIRFLDDPLAGTLRAQAGHAARAGLLEDPQLDGIYDLALLNKVLRAEGEPTVDDAALGVE
ncbi:ABC transporter substrate-binding protein [Streptomyces spinoverrucosus]|uniref:ABC transporter substrate-binding protein n=1 Tax=Streptomyces spinoverrucosus TaxID=284043 RepID=UPI0018C355E1|nr:ABC transporter substrate-binding protein [Streptomyces spinoverrucosus]MBG0851761.1 ABC transporter substrate-binding protein [Streptomyces spinoverrucosus]